MQKIPTVFERDWDGDRSLVLDVPNPEADWVFAGEGVATRKYDGTSCLVRDGKLFKRHEVKPGRPAPEGFEQVDERKDKDGGTILTGWVPVGEGPEDQWHREALESLIAGIGIDGALVDADGTYELLGPKVQKNPEATTGHILLCHADATPYIVPRTFEGMRDVLQALNMVPNPLDPGIGIEGFVFHHPDGRMAKIKARDFGIRRATATL